MDTITIPFWIKILFPTLLAIGAYLMTTSSAKVKASKGSTTVTKRVIGKDTIKARLDGVIKEANRNVKQQRSFYTKLGQEVPFKIQMQEMLIDTATGQEGARNIFILIVSGIITLVIGFLGFGRVGMAAIFVAGSILLTAIMFTNMLTMKSKAAKQKKALNVLTVLHSQYQNNPTFVDAIAQSRDIFSPTSYEYKVINNYYDRTQNLNMSRDMALQLLVEELDNNVHIKQYMEIVLQAETVDPSYKLALEGIPLSLKNVISDRTMLVTNTIVISWYTVITTIAVTYSAVIKYLLNPLAWTEAINVGGEKYITAGVIFYLSLVMVMTYSNRIKAEEKWGADK